MVKINWTSTASQNWQWLSCDQRGSTIPIIGTKSQKGMISLDPDPDYWYCCGVFILQSWGFGYAAVRYWQENGQDFIQVRTQAIKGAPLYCGNQPVEWTAEGKPGKTSNTQGTGGINLQAQIS